MCAVVRLINTESQNEIYRTIDTIVEGPNGIIKHKKSWNELRL